MNRSTIIYQVTNLINGKIYIGLTKQKLLRRWQGHVQYANNGSKTALHCAIRKYGQNAFSVTAIASCLCRDESGDVEAEIICDRGSKAPNGYNLTSGGDGVVGLSKEIRDIISQKNKGRKLSPDALKRRAERQRGRIVSDEVREKLRVAHTGKRLTAEHRRKLSEAKIGKSMPPRSENHRKKISEGLKQAWARRKMVANG